MSKDGFSLLALFLGIVGGALLLGFVFIAYYFPIVRPGGNPGYPASREGARERTCYSNMRRILGAVEAYNMDHEIMLENLTNIDVITGGLLEKGGYLKKGISPPTPSCSYRSLGSLTGSGKIVCDVHGAVEEPLSSSR